MNNNNIIQLTPTPANYPTPSTPLDVKMYQPYLENYEKSMKAVYDTSKQQLDSNRDQQYTDIMASANKGGMMYSNFPARTKAQYVTSSYQPNYAKLATTYSTGKDSLRANIVKNVNAINEYNRAIEKLNNS